MPTAYHFRTILFHQRGGIFLPNRCDDRLKWDVIAGKAIEEKLLKRAHTRDHRM